MKTIERFLLTAVTALGLFISIIMSILERRKEFAVLKAVGGRHITALVLLESLMLSLALVGLALGYGAATVAGHYLKLAASLPGGFLLEGTTLLAVLVGTLGGIYPEANRFAPAEIFR